MPVQFMNTKLTFVDVEYVNENADCICEIAMVAMVDGKEVFRRTELIQPNAEFNMYQSKIHGIYPEDVEGCMNFAEFYQEVKEYFSEDWILVGHNINSDIHVIQNDLRRYEIECPILWCIDTQDVAKKIVYHDHPVRGSMNLHAVCRNMGISHNPHYAEADCQACVDIMNQAFDQSELPLDEFIREPDVRKENQRRENHRIWKMLEPGTILKDRNYGEVELVSLDEEHATVSKNGITMTYRFPFCFDHRILSTIPGEGQEGFKKPA